MKTSTRRYARVFLSLLLGLVLLWLITRGQDIEQIIREMRQANYLWVGLAMLCAILSHFVRAIRWNMLIAATGYRTKTIETFYAVMTGYMANLAIPRMGEVTRCFSLSKSSKTPFNALAGTVLAERVFDLISLMVIGFLIIAGQLDFLRSFLKRVFWNPLVRSATENWLLFAVTGMLVLLLLAAGIYVVRKKTRRSVEGDFFYKIKRQWRGFAHGFASIGAMRGKGWFILHTFLIWGLYFMTVYLCFFAIGATAHLTPLAGLTLLAVGSLGIIAPVPGGIGTYHFVTIITLTELYGIASEPATSYAYITHANQVIINLLAGTFSWIMLSVGTRKTQTSKL